MTDSTIKYGLIPEEHWVQPDWIDEEKASEARKDMVKHNVIYGGAFIPLSKCHTLVTHVGLKAVSRTLTPDSCSFCAVSKSF